MFYVLSRWLAFRASRCLTPLSPRVDADSAVTPYGFHAQIERARRHASTISPRHGDCRHNIYAAMIFDMLSWR